MINLTHLERHMEVRSRTGEITGVGEDHDERTRGQSRVNAIGRKALSGACEYGSRILITLFMDH